MFKIGEKIRLIRINKGLSQQYMAFELDISQAAYSKMERDEILISLPRLYEIAEIFKMSPFELMPKPKYGSGLNRFTFTKTLKKILNFFPKRSQKVHKKEISS